MRSAPRLVIIALLGLLLALPVTATALPASAAPGDSLVVQPSSPSAPPSSPSTSAPAGPNLEPDQEADKAETNRKLIMGVSSVVLLGLVIWGRSIRRKRRKATEGG